MMVLKQIGSTFEYEQPKWLLPQFQFWFWFWFEIFFYKGVRYILCSLYFFFIVLLDFFFENFSWGGSFLFKAVFAWKRFLSLWNLFYSIRDCADLEILFGSGNSTLNWRPFNVKNVYQIGDLQSKQLWQIGYCFLDSLEHR